MSKMYFLIDDFEWFAQILESKGLPVSDKKADSLNVKYKGETLTVYKTKKGYKVAPKISWAAFIILWLISLVLLRKNIIQALVGGGDTPYVIGTMVGLLIGSLGLAAAMLYVFGGIYNATKKKVVSDFCDEFKV
ncbi:MAG: hypothetical protein IJK05_03775 [Bacteroidales bacterium]|nr:hypothetical protein [Bacteroidales bacterium]